MRTVSDIINSYDYLYDLSVYQVSELLDEIREEAIKQVKAIHDNGGIGFTGLMIQFFSITKEDLECTCTEYIKGTFADCPIHKFTKLDEAIFDSMKHLTEDKE